MSKMQKIGKKDGIFPLIDDIAFYRDINNDFSDRRFETSFDALEKKAIAILKKTISLEEGLGRVNVAIIGNFSSGKSTFINSLLGKAICPMKIIPTTCTITKFIYSDKPEILLEDQDGTLKNITENEYHKLAQYKTGTTDNPRNYRFEYRYPFEELRSIAIYDTPGFENSSNKEDERVTEDTVKKTADVVFFIQDINKSTLTDNVKTRIEKLQESRPRTEWYLILNRTDDKNQRGRNEIYKYISKKFGNRFKEIFFYDSKEVLETSRNSQIMETLGNIFCKQIEINIKKNQPNFTINVSGEKENEFGDKYTVNFNKKSVDLQIKNSEFTKVKKAILAILKIISDQKSVYFKNQMQHLEKYYQKEREKQLFEIQKSLKSYIKNGAPDIKAESILNDFKEFVSEVQHAVQPASNKKREKCHKEFYTVLDKILVAEEIENTGRVWDDAKIILINKNFIKLKKLTEKHFNSIRSILTEWETYFREKYPNNVAAETIKMNILSIDEEKRNFFTEIKSVLMSEDEEGENFFDKIYSSIKNATEKLEEIKENLSEKAVKMLYKKLDHIPQKIQHDFELKIESAVDFEIKKAEETLEKVNDFIKHKQEEGKDVR